MSGRHVRASVAGAIPARLVLALLVTATLAACGKEQLPERTAVDAPDAADATPLPDGGTSETARDGEASSQGDEPCAGVCAVLGSTPCPPDTAACLAGCAAQLGEACGERSRALFACQAGLSPADFTCDSRGRVVMSPGSCQPENDALVGCLLGP